MSELDYNYISELVECAKAGDSDSFAELYAATYKKQYSFAYCYLKDEFLAQDALQETYILALKNLSTLKDSKLFVSWLNQINFRVCFSMANKQSRYNSETAAFADGAADSVEAMYAGPEEQVVKIDTDRYVFQQVMNLPYSESQSIFLHYYKNLAIDEIARLMETSRSTVKRNLASGRKRLKASLI